MIINSGKRALWCGVLLYCALGDIARCDPLMVKKRQSSSKTGAEKLRELRELMREAKYYERPIEAYIIPTEDAHQSEYITDTDKRRVYISGFKGSFGTAVVTQSKALLWTDGRYFLEASLELDPKEEWELMKVGVTGTPTIGEWLASNLPEGSVVAADPHLLSYTSWVDLQTHLYKAGHWIVPLDKNLVDVVWGDERPERILNRVFPQKFAYTGKTSAEKINECREEMRRKETDALVITALDEIAYLLNWRGSDIPYNPVFFSYVIITADRVHVFINDKRLTNEALEQLKSEGVEPQVLPYEEVRAFLKRVCMRDEVKKVWISHKSSYAFHSDCEKKEIHYVDATPVAIMKLTKTPVEVEGMKKAHLRDAVALVKYFAWLEATVNENKTVVTERSGNEKLLQFREEQKNFMGASFATIAAVGKNGAQIHYGGSPYEVPITNTELYMCDSGGQYYEGTTDVTRTLHFGEPNPYEKECFTRVFKAQTALSMTKFPKFTGGNLLDVVARKVLWDLGLDYGHGTGHGIGSYLNVHEPPIGIARRQYPNDPGMQAGMFTSNEPGYYEEGKFGIRLENIELVTNVTTKYKYPYEEFLGFETVTLVPIQTKLLDLNDLNSDEIEHLNKYHERIYSSLAPRLQGPENAQALQWLYRETRPVIKRFC